MAAIEDCERRIVAEFKSRTPKSAVAFERAARVLPGGVSGNLRFFHPYPLYMTEGYGARSRDLDGNFYLDCFLCNGPLLLGHRHPAVEAALDRAENIGALLLNPMNLIECAEALCEIVPCAEQVRFLNSGTEAVLSAVRYARAFTGRSKVVKFFGHYHGQHDQFLIGAGPSRTPLGDGVPASAYADTLTLPFNDLEAVEEACARDDDIAAVILDPAMHSGGLWGVEGAFLEGLRALTAEKNIVLIFDEVITGFRVSPGGAQRAHNVTPDLATFAKALGAGEKIAAVAGRADILSVVDPTSTSMSRRAFQSGTGNDGTRGLLAATAAMTTYKQLGEAGAYQALDQRAERLARGLEGAFASVGIPCHVNHISSMLQMFLTSAPPRFVEYASLDQRLVDLFFLALMTRDVMLTLPTSNHIYLSFAHSDDDIASIVGAARDVIEEYNFADAYASVQGGMHAQ
jgi:glutamate-1-semialdehyde 2,1-aminomutase